MVRRTILQRLTSRPFVLAVAGAVGAWVAYKYHVPNEVIASIEAPIITFILGESYRDGKVTSAAVEASKDGDA